MLSVTNYYEGPWLPPYGASPNQGTLFLGNILPDYGHFADIMLPDVNGTYHPPFPEGSGIIARIEFNATMQALFPDTMECPLHLYDTKAASSDGVLFNTTSPIDGLYTIKPYMLDVSEVVPCDQDGDAKSIFMKGSTAYFKITVNNTSGPRDSVVTVNVFDELGIPLGLPSFKGPMTTGTYVFILGLPLPNNASSGTATVYVNVFTDWPHNGGVACGPEKSATFQIAGS
jgi:hypothetical protein